MISKIRKKKIDRYTTNLRFARCFLCAFRVGIRSSIVTTLRSSIVLPPSPVIELLSTLKMYKMLIMATEQHDPAVSSHFNHYSISLALIILLKEIHPREIL